jgi:glycosyltransferase involved in cell wall biosynthesis
MDQISVVIPTYNSERTLSECLKTLIRLSSEHRLQSEVIIVDAGSKDNTFRIAKELADKVVVFPGVSRGEARNRGAKIASNDILAFLDSDCVITADWVKQLRKTDTSSLNSTVFSGPVVLADAETFIGKAIRDLLSSHIFTLSSLTFSTKNEDKIVYDAPASNIVVSKAFFQQIGCFPDLNFDEDTIFCKKVGNSGGKIFYYASLKVLHKKTFDKIRQFEDYFFQYGRSCSRTLRHYPRFIRKYAVAAMLITFFLIGSLIVLLVDLSWSRYLLAFVIFYFICTTSYSLLKFRKIHAAIIPILFLTLALSYTGGFYCGLLKE